MLFICEKPSQGRDIAAVLGATQQHDGYMSGNNAIVTWCLGHLLLLAPPEYYCPNVKPWRHAVLPVVPTTWEMQPNPRTKLQLAVVTRLLREASHVVIATDADREGEAIAREVMRYCHYSGKVERLWLSALDTVSIKKALAHLKSGNSTEALYHAALGRSRADWLVGMNMTMATTAHFSKGKGVLSVGRVQTPTLQLVVNRDLAIEGFTVSDYYLVDAHFKTENKTVFSARWQIPEKHQDEAGHCIKRSTAEMVCADIEGKAAFVAEFGDNTKATPAPLCLSLSALQKIASQQLGLGAKQTIEIAQALYEKYKAVTYPRTDSGYLPLSQHAEANAVLAAISATQPTLQTLLANTDVSLKSPVWNDEKISAHHAIIPTSNAKVSTASMGEHEKALYAIISRYYIAQFLGAYTFAQRKVTVNCDNHLFVASENIPLALGWKAALTKMTTEDVGKDNKLPLLTENQSLLCVATGVDTKETTPPAFFTEGTLIMAMKNIAREIDDEALKKILKANAGIGTEATRANIIDVLLKREFIAKDGKFLHSTTKGRELLDKLPHVVKHPATTARWEQMLNDVANGQTTLTTFLDGQTTVLNTMLERLGKIAQTQPRGDTNAEHQCPDCKSEMLRRKGKKGFFWGCTAYPNCNTTLPDNRGKPMPRKAQTLSHHDCPECKSHKLVKRQGKKKAIFWGCSGYPECNAIFWDKGNMPDFYNLPTPREN